MRDDFPRDLAEWPAFAAVHRDNGVLARWLAASWIDGTLFDLPGIGPESLTLRELLAATLAAFAPIDDLIIAADPRTDSAVVRRWCWVEPWLLDDQDEDIFLTGVANVAPLLEEAGLGCPKAEYARSIAAHTLRDAVHGTLVYDTASLRSLLESYSTYLELARATGAQELASYLERLTSYARPRRMDKHSASQCVRDVCRCNDPGELTLHRRHGTYLIADDHRPGHLIALKSRTGELSTIPAR